MLTFKPGEKNWRTTKPVNIPPQTINRNFSWLIGTTEEIFVFSGTKLKIVADKKMLREPEFGQH
jgi:hypothetical protein